MALISTGALVGGSAMADQPKKKRVRVETTIADMSSRALAIKWPVPSSVARLSLEPTETPDGEDAVIGVTEFADGTLGIMLMRSDPEGDQWVAIKKENLSNINEAIYRCQHR